MSRRNYKLRMHAIISQRISSVIIVRLPELKSRNKMILLLLFIYHWTLVVCQTYPNITFMDQNLPNNSYFDFSRVGRADNGSDSIHCHTDLENCCSMTEGPHHRGDWFFPNRSRLDFHLRLCMRVVGISLLTFRMWVGHKTSRSWVVT